MPPKRKTNTPTSSQSKRVKSKPKPRSPSDSDSDSTSDIPPSTRYVPVIIHSQPSNPPKRQRKPTPQQILEDKIKRSLLDPKVKEEVLKRFAHIDSDTPKQREWFDHLLSIPFQQYTSLPVSKGSSRKAIQQYFEQARTYLDQSVYGMKAVKDEMIHFLAQCISTDQSSHPRILGLKGNAGVGKTELCISGLSKALQRPFQMVSCGGIRDSSHFIGFDWTYTGSRYGCIVQKLIESKVMNPIFFFDELDKISQTHEGMDIQNILIHLTDPVQNHHFQDKYFSGIPIDLSRVIFIFSFNDDTLLHPVLKDRLHILNIPDPSLSDKIKIAQHYLKPQIAKNVGLQSTDVLFSDEVIRHMITHFCAKDKGVRSLKRCMETIFLQLNTSQYLKADQRPKSLKDLSFPFTLDTNTVIDELLTEMHKPNEEEWLSHMFL